VSKLTSGSPPGICYLGDKPHSPNLSDLAECVILCTSWLQSPGKVYCWTVNIWVTLVELRVPILSAGAGTRFLISKFLITKFLITKFLITKF
jgi:hypothetical protein